MSSLALAALAALAVTMPCSPQDEADVVDLAGGVPGAAGWLRVGYEGSPVVGRPLEIRLEGAEPGAIGFMAASLVQQELHLPVPGATVHLGLPFFLDEVVFFDESAVSTPLFATPFVLPVLVGVELVIQGVAADPTVPDGLVYSDGLRMRFGNASTLPPLSGVTHGRDDFYRSFGVAVGNFDGGGGTDFAAIGTGSFPNAWIETFFGEGDGTFPFWVNTSTGPVPHGIASADVDGDGIDEILVTSTEDGTVWIHSQVTAISPPPPLIVPPSTHPPIGGASPAKPFYIETVDMDGDGVLDIVTANQGPPSLSVLFLDSSAQLFDEIVEVPLPGDPVDLEIADVDGDGVLDAALALPLTTEVAVVRGLGQRAFAPAFTIATSDAPVALTIADMDGDGDQDLAVGYDERPRVGVLLGDGASPSVSFGSERVVELPSTGPVDQYEDQLAVVGVVDVIAFDGDEDGVSEIVAVNHRALELNVVRAADAQGVALAVPEVTQRIRTIHDASKLVLGDFDGDGRFEPLCYGSRGFAQVHFATKDGAPTGATFAEAPEGAELMAVGDFSGDGWDDVAVCTSSSNMAQVFVAGPEATLDAGSELVALPGTIWIASIDLDGDARDDLAMGNGNSILVHRSLGGGDYATPQVFFDQWGTSRVVICDWDDDGDEDLVGTDGAGGDLVVFSNDGTGGFDFGTALPLGTDAGSFDVGNLDGDAVPDAVVLTPQGYVRILRSEQGSTVAPPIWFPGIPTTNGRVDLLDANRDGLLDLVLGGSDSVFVCLGDLSGAFGPATESVVSHGLRGQALVDLDGDGVSDLVQMTNVNIEYAGSLLISKGLGDGSFVRLGRTGPTPVELSGTAPPVAEILAGDFDRDGVDDVVVLQTRDRRVFVLRNLMYR